MIVIPQRLFSDPQVKIILRDGNVSPQQWIRKKRLEKAYDLSRDAEVSVTDLAFAVGYENISYFIKEFKKEYGQSPKQLMLDRRKRGKRQ